jgi:hypothetical protein
MSDRLHALVAEALAHGELHDEGWDRCSAAAHDVIAALKLREVTDALHTADAFMQSVDAWSGHEDDLSDALAAVGDAIAACEGAAA